MLLWLAKNNIIVITKKSAKYIVEKARQELDTNTEYFLRLIGKIRRSISLLCFSLITLVTVPFVLINYSNEYYIYAYVQLFLCCVSSVAFFLVWRFGYSTAVAVLVFILANLVIAFGTLAPSVHPTMAMFFFAPPLIAYAFFSQKIALSFTIVSFVVLGTIYYFRFNDSTEIAEMYLIPSLLFSIIAFVTGLHILISAHTLIEKQLMKLASTDALTGLPNRLYFNDRMAQEIERSKRDKTPLCLALIDLDHFKKVNDNHGHDCGDEVLQRVTEILRESLRYMDVLCRVGGEELAVIFSNTSLKNTGPLLERMRLAIEQQPTQWRQYQIPMTASIGCVELSDTNETLDKLFSAADRCLYQAKKEGRNRVCFYRQE